MTLLAITPEKDTHAQNRERVPLIYSSVQWAILVQLVTINLLLVMHSQMIMLLLLIKAGLINKSTRDVPRDSLNLIRAA